MVVKVVTNRDDKFDTQLLSNPSHLHTKNPKAVSALPMLTLR